VLADVMEVLPGEDVLDLGCGSGAIGLLAAHRSGTGAVTLLDVDSEAVRCAERTIVASGLTNCRAMISDVASAVLDQRFDRVVANPPFHVGKQTDLAVPTQFILDAWRVLRPGGTLQLVANRTLPYEKIVYETFGNLTTMHDGPRFKVLSARR
jgi:16S rRNA (guanine1207-N2)-methyltransferase